MSNLHCSRNMCYLYANAQRLLQDEAQQLQSNSKHRTTAGLKSKNGSAVRPKIRT